MGKRGQAEPRGHTEVCSVTYEQEEAETAPGWVWYSWELPGTPTPSVFYGHQQPHREPAPGQIPLSCDEHEGQGLLELCEQ